MKILNLQLKNFRNYDNLNINLENNLNILIGNNAQGKTSILEAIYILGITKSPITNNEYECISYGKKNSIIKGKIQLGGNNNNLEIRLTENLKQIKLNNKKISKIREYVSKFNIVLFSPLDLELVKGSPNIRRKFLNIEIGQLDNNYLNVLSKYNKVNKKRNEYLKLLKNSSPINYDYIEIINNKYIEYAVKIYEYRINFLKKINKYIDTIFFNITGFSNLVLNYIPNIKIDAVNFNEEEIKKCLSEKINQNLQKEILLGNSLYGPHKDDFLFLLKDRNLNLYGSQGQQRCAVISLKLSEINLFYNSKKEYPIVLLDDVFSELDKTTRNRLLKNINKEVQILITTNDLNSISKTIINESNIKQIINGKIEEKSK